jgi:hypothetical protein
MRSNMGRHQWHEATGFALGESYLFFFSYFGTLEKFGWDFSIATKEVGSKINLNQTHLEAHIRFFSRSMQKDKSCDILLMQSCIQKG